jgi:uroporphyrinogen-III synthase
VRIDATVMLSGSAVRGMVALAEEGDLVRIRSLPCLCIGPETAAEAMSAGFTEVLVADRAETSALADLAATTLLAHHEQAGENA